MCYKIKSIFDAITVTLNFALKDMIEPKLSAMGVSVRPRSPPPRHGEDRRRAETT